MLRVGCGNPFIPNDLPPVLQASLRAGETQCLRNDVRSNNVKEEKIVHGGADFMWCLMTIQKI